MTATMSFVPVAAPPVDYGTLDWQKVRLGGLGYVTGIRAAADGSWLLAKTDVGGFYRRASADTEWTQLVTSAGFPSAWRDPQNGNDSNQVGCWEIAMAGDNSTAYAMFKAKLFKTTDKGVNWTKTNFDLGTGINNAPSNRQPYERLSMNKMMVDPSDPNTIIVWISLLGPYRSTDGGATWTQPTGLPSLYASVIGYISGTTLTATGVPVGRLMVGMPITGTGIAAGTTVTALGSGAGGAGTYTVSASQTVGSSADPKSFTAGEASGYRLGLLACDRGSTVGSSRVWFGFAHGWGLYRSMDNGATWASAGAGFDTYLHAYDIQYLSSGKVAVIDADATEDNIRVWAHGSGYSSITSTPAGFKGRYLSISPANANDWLLSAGGSSGHFTRSLDGGATWTAAYAAATIRSQHVETRAMSYTQDLDNAGSFAWSIAKPEYHPTDGYMYWPTGYGVCRSLLASSGFQAPSSGDKLVVNDFAAGMEELVAMFGRILPDGTMILASQDKKMLKVTDPTQYLLPSFVAGTALGNGFYVDYVEGTPAKIGYATSSNLSGYSDNGGLSGTPFAVQPKDPAGTVRGGGSILRLTDQNFLRFQGQNGRPIYSLDKGASWAVPTFTGATLPADGTSQGFGFGLIDYNHRCAVKSKTTPGVVYCVNYGEGGSNTLRGCWKSVDYGVTWTKQSSASIFITGHMTLERADGVLYYTAGSTGSYYVQETPTAYLYRSADDGVTWTAVRTVSGFSQEVTEVLQIGIGAPASGSSNKTVWIIGWVDHVLGVWYSTDRGLTWTKLSDVPGFDSPIYLAADPLTFGRLLIGGSGTGHWIRS